MCGYATQWIKKLTRVLNFSKAIKSEISKRKAIIFSLYFNLQHGKTRDLQCNRSVTFCRTTLHLMNHFV